MLQLVLWSTAWVAGESVSFEQRVNAVRAVERARYALTLGAAVPFDEAYPRDVLEQRVRRFTWKHTPRLARRGHASSQVNR